MTDETIVAVYDTTAEADAAVRDLKAADVPADAISQHRGRYWCHDGYGRPGS